MNTPRWRGVFPALTTQFTAADALDFDAMGRHLAFQLDAGVHGLVILGSLGENAALDGDEKRALMAFFANEVGGRVPVLAGIAESSQREACALAEAAAEAGCDGLMLLPPMRYASDRRETVSYLRRVAQASDLPVMLYNNPVAYGTDLQPADFAELADVPQFVAIKESSADTRRLPDIRRLSGDRFAMFCGVDDLALESFLLGAVGWVAGLVVAFPRESVRLWELAMSGRWDEARRLYEWFLPLLHLDCGPKFVQQIKLVQARMGHGHARVRAPRLALNEAEASAVEVVLERALAERPDA